MVQWKLCFSVVTNVHFGYALHALLCWWKTNHNIMFKMEFHTSSLNDKRTHCHFFNTFLGIRISSFLSIEAHQMNVIELSDVLYHEHDEFVQNMDILLYEESLSFFWGKKLLLIIIIQNCSFKSFMKRDFWFANSKIIIVIAIIWNL